MTTRMDDLREYAYRDVLDLVEPEEMLAFIRLYRAAACVAGSNPYDVPYHRLRHLRRAVEALSDPPPRGWEGMAGGA